MHCRLFTAFASDPAKASQQDDEAWQAGFKLSYDVGSSVLRGRQQLPALCIDAATGGSHLMRLALQHQELVAAPTPVAGQGTQLPPATLTTLQPNHLRWCVPLVVMASVCWTQQAQHMLLITAGDTHSRSTFVSSIVSLFVCDWLSLRAALLSDTVVKTSCSKTDVVLLR